MWEYHFSQSSYALEWVEHSNYFPVRTAHCTPIFPSLSTAPLIFQNFKRWLLEKMILIKSENTFNRKMSVESTGWWRNWRFSLYVGIWSLKDSAAYLVSKSRITIEPGSLKCSYFDFDVILYDTPKLPFILSRISLSKSNTIGSHT